MHSTVSLPSTSRKIEQRRMESRSTRRSSMPSGSWIVHPLYTVGLLSGTSMGVEYQYCGPEVSAVFLTVVVGICLAAVVVMMGV
jgi:hypothetical protein